MPVITILVTAIFKYNQIGCLKCRPCLGDVSVDNIKIGHEDVDPVHRALVKLVMYLYVCVRERFDSSAVLCRHPISTELVALRGGTTSRSGSNLVPSKLNLPEEHRRYPI